VLDRLAASWRAEVRRFQPLRATVTGTVTGGGLRVAESFAVVRRSLPDQPARPAQLTNSRE
jgi:hypothetical protein